MQNEEISKIKIKTKKHNKQQNKENKKKNKENRIKL